MTINLRELARKPRQVQRLPALLMVLARHGFGHLIQAMNLQGYLPSKLRVGLSLGESSEARGVSTAQRLRLVLEGWGPTAVKLGQMLSTRPDIIPPAYQAELRKLTDSVPPFPSPTARKIIEQEIGRPIFDVFASFEDQPIAAGSIAQAHSAVLKTGEKVVVKVKRPNIQAVALADLDLLETLAVPLLEWIEDLKPLRPAMLLQKFRRSLLRELDFVAEASVTTKIRADLAGFAYVQIPVVFWNLTTPSILTMQHLSGTGLSDVQAVAALPVDHRLLARHLVECFLTQFFKTGLFHADPHGGNILITPHGRIALLDFGMSGRLDSELRGSLATTFIALARGDLDMITEIYTDIGVIAEETDLSSLKADMAEMLDKYYGIPIKRVDMTRCFADAMSVFRRHNVYLPRDFVLLAKSFSTMLMMARQLDPEFDLAGVARPFARSLLAHKFSPARLGHDALATAWSLTQTLRRFPRDMRTFMRKLVTGRLQFQLQHHVKAFEGFTRELDRATNRLAFSIIVGAVVIGSALVLHARVRPHVEDVLPGGFGRFFADNMPDTSVLGLGGFLFAGVLGLLLAWAIWRHGRL